MFTLDRLALDTMPYDIGTIHRKGELVRYVLGLLDPVLPLEAPIGFVTFCYCPNMGRGTNRRLDLCDCKDNRR